MTLDVFGVFGGFLSACILAMPKAIYHHHHLKTKQNKNLGTIDVDSFGPKNEEIFFSLEVKAGGTGPLGDRRWRPQMSNFYDIQ